MKLATVALAPLLLPLACLSQAAVATRAGSSAEANAPATRATMQTMQIPSHGAMLNALVYVAAGPGPHPAVVLLHGFPGNERNLDLAQAIRQQGWDVLYFNYRGSWGTPGDFSFQHSIEDTAAAVAYLRDPEHARSLRLDPQRIVLIGHSMGGLMAIQAAAVDPSVAAVGLISAADMAGHTPIPLPKDTEAATVKRVADGLEAEGMAPLAGCTPDSLARELVTDAGTLRFASKVDRFGSRPVLVVTSNDGLAPSDDAFAQALEQHGDSRVQVVHFDTDHAYSDQRPGLIAAVLQWLGRLPVAPTPNAAR